MWTSLPIILSLADKEWKTVGSDSRFFGRCGNSNATSIYPFIIHAVNSRASAYKFSGSPWDRSSPFYSCMPSSIVSWGAAWLMKLKQLIAVVISLRCHSHCVILIAHGLNRALEPGCDAKTLTGFSWRCIAMSRLWNASFQPWGNSP